MSGPLLLAIESSCDETGIALVEDGRRILANVVASARSRSTRRPAGSCPEVAARAHLRWIVPVLDEALADAGVTLADVDGVAVTYGPGLAGSLLVGINFAKALAWVHDMPLVGVNHLEGHVYAAWLRDPGEAEREEPVFPLVALVVSGGHTFLVEMRDHLTYRLLGPTVDDAAGEAFDKVGRLLGPRLPGRAGDLARPPRARPRRDRVFPRAWLGDSYDFSFSGPQDGGAADHRRGARRRRAAADEPEAPLPDAIDRRARLGLPGRGRGRARDQDDPGGRGGRGARRSCWAAASRRTRPCASAARRPRRRRAASADRAAPGRCARTTGR